MDVPPLDIPKVPRPPRSPRNASKSARPRINTHAARDRRDRMEMVDSKRTRAEVLKEIEMESNVRRYRPPPASVRNFIRSKETITPRETEKMTENVERYLALLKKSRPPRESFITPRELRFNEIPQEILTPSARQLAPRGPKKITRAFDLSEEYKSKQKPLTSNLPDLFITRKFHSFVVRSNERVPKILSDAVYGKDDETVIKRMETEIIEQSTL